MGDEDARAEAAELADYTLYSDVRVAAALERGAVHVCVDEGAPRWDAVAAAVLCLLSRKRGPVGLFARAQLWPLVRHALQRPGDENSALVGNTGAVVPVVLQDGEALSGPGLSMASSAVFLLDVGAAGGARTPADVAAFGSAVIDTDRVTAHMLRVLRTSVLSGRVAVFSSGGCGAHPCPVAGGLAFEVLHLPFRRREPPTGLLPCALKGAEERREYLDAFVSEVEKADAPVCVRHALMTLCLSCAEREGNPGARRMRAVSGSMEGLVRAAGERYPLHSLPSRARALSVALHGSTALLRTLKEPLLEQALAFVADRAAAQRSRRLDVNLLVVLPLLLHAEAARRLARAPGRVQVYRASTRGATFSRQGAEVVARIQELWSASAELRAARQLLLALRRDSRAAARAVYNEGVLPSSLPAFLQNVRVLVADRAALSDLMSDVFDDQPIHQVFFAFPCDLAHAWPRGRVPAPEVTASQWPLLQ